MSIDRVLALAPSLVLQLARTRSLEELHRIITGLIQVWVGTRVLRVLGNL